MDGLISFWGSFHAIRAETVLKRHGLAAQLIPGPKELSPNCGVALRLEYDQREHVLSILAEKHVKIDGVHFYRPRTDEWRGHSDTRIGLLKRWM
jgi:hypothetical protein